MLFSVFKVLGECYAVEQGGIFLILIRKNIVNSIIMIMGFSCLSYHILTALWLFRKKYIQKNDTEKVSCNRIETAKKLFLCWLPYFLLLYPGTILWDTGTQLNQFFGYQTLTNDSPYIQTFLIGFFVWIGSKIGSATLGVALYLLLQMLYMSLVAAYAIDIMKKNGVDSKVCRIITIIYAINVSDE